MTTTLDTSVVVSGFVVGGEGFASEPPGWLWLPLNVLWTISLRLGASISIAAGSGEGEDEASRALNLLGVGDGKGEAIRV